MKMIESVIVNNDFGDLVKSHISNVELNSELHYFTTKNNEIAAVSYPPEGNDDCFQIEAQSFWFAHRNRVILSVYKKIKSKFLDRHTDEDLSFFDVGGGNGFVSLHLKASGVKVVVVEAGNGAHNCVKRNLVTIRADLKSLAWLPGSRDVGIFDVLEHIEDDFGFLVALRKILGEKGQLFLAVPAHDRLWSAADEEIGHFRRYNRASLEALLNKAGFEVLYQSHFFSFLFFPILLQRVFLRRKTLNEKEKVQLTTDHLHSGIVIELLCRIELMVMNFFSLSFGSSLIAVGRVSQSNMPDQFDEK